MMSQLFSTLTKRLAGAGAFALLACASASAAVSAPRAQAAIPPGAAASPAYLYVCNQNDATVSVIDVATMKVARTVDLQKLGFGPNAKPHHVVVEPDGSYWYVSLIGENRILKMDRQDKVVASAEFETPGMMALDPRNDMLFVGRSMTAVNPPQRIGIVNRKTMAIDEVDVFFPRPHAMAMDTANNTVYTASLAVNQLAAIDPETQEVKLTPVDGPQHSVMMFTVSPDGKTLVASGELSHKVLIWDVAQPMQPKLTATIDVGPQPFDPIFTRDGKFVYLGNKAANTVTVIDVANRKVAKVIEGEGLLQPHGTAVSPDGRWVFVSNNNLGDGGGHAMHGADAHPATSSASAGAAGGTGTVVVIDTRTQEISSVIPVGHNAAGLALAVPAR
jgi:YVTN family beta-propeller protein